MKKTNYTRETHIHVQPFQAAKGEAVTMCYRKAAQKRFDTKTELVIPPPSAGRRASAGAKGKIL